MASELPLGHPGDVVWRLALTRTLASMKAVVETQVQQATVAAAKGGLFATHLIDAGANPDKVLTALAIATGAHSAPRHEVRHPAPELAGQVEETVLRAALAVPFAVEGELLCLAFAVPLGREWTTLLPPHRAFVGLELDIAQGLEQLFPARRKRSERGGDEAHPVMSPPPAPPGGMPAVANPDAPSPRPSAPLPSLDGPSSFDGVGALDGVPAPLSGPLPELADLPPLPAGQAAGPPRTPPQLGAPAGPAPGSAAPPEPAQGGLARAVQTLKAGWAKLKQKLEPPK